MSENTNSSRKAEMAGLKTMQLNDQKAGMQGLDKEMINNIIYEASKGTSYFNFQEKRQQRIDQKVKEMLLSLEKFNDEQRKQAMERMTALGTALEGERDMSHSIVHIDMDAFYAAVEMQDNPELKDKPMAVGSLSMLSTSNYHARKFGVRAAMPGFIAKKLCPELTIVPCNFEKYRKVSEKVRNTVKEYDPNFLPVGLDELYLDLTNYILVKHKERVHTEHHEVGSCSSGSEYDDDDDMISICMSLASSKCKLCCNYNSISDEDRDSLAYGVVQEIRKKIMMETGLTASAGIAANTMLAKVCSDQNKPNGQFQIPSNVEEVKSFISSLPIKKISGIGPVQAQILNALGIEICADLWSKRDLLDLLFSPTSVHFYIRVALGIGSTSLKNDHVRKSIGGEETFREIHCPEDLHKKCEELSEETAEDLRSRNLVGKVVMLKIKTVNFDVRTRHLSLPEHTSDKEIITRAAKKLLDAEINMASPEPLRLRLMGVRISGLIDESSIPKSEKQQQVKLKDFLKGKLLPTKEKLQSEGSSSKLICPVCAEELQVDLSTFNSHIDDCLKKNQHEDHLSEKSSAALNSSSPGSIKNASHLCASNDLSGDSEIFHPDAPELKPDDTSDFILNDESVSDDTHCPVCGLKQNISTLSQLNEHIDNCLSQSAIKEILSSENHAAGQLEKRKMSSAKDSQSKKVKNTSDTCRKIEDYFRT